MPATESNLAIIKHIMDTFARSSDTAPLFDAIADDAVFELAIPRELPLARIHRGKAGLTAYFERARELMELLDSHVEDYLANDRRVVVIGHERYRARRTGVVYATAWVLVFQFEAGKIVRMHSFEDLTGLTEPQS